MRSLPATLLAELSGVPATEARALPSARGVAFHSARVRPGDAFFALPGASSHGLRYADAALQAGAAFIVSDRPHPRGLTVPDPARLLLQLGRVARAALQGPVIGVTGSAGKTSTRALLAAALGAHATRGNFNTPLALAQTLVEAWLEDRTGAHDRLVLELGIDHTGEMDELVELTRPTLGVVTLIAPAHLDGLGSVEGVAREKFKLLTGVRHAWVSAQAYPFLTPAQRAALQGRLTVYGLDGRETPTGGEAKRVTGHFASAAGGGALHALGLRVPLALPSPALAENALCALAVAAHLGVDPAAAAARLQGAVLEPGRLQRHQLGALTLLDDAYNSNPASVRAALTALAALPRPHTAVLGDMLELGAASAELHRALAEDTAALDAVVAVGPAMRALAEADPRAVYLEAFDLEALLALVPERGTLLVKGSRGVRLERLTEALLRRYAEQHDKPPEHPEGARG
ncbi:UDP-N-acetylmuramoyl-tripeptide--D-alanyl-D-alanine ligase [Truepera radiovictrix]|uniref:UDP-N-acetylmuramoyl-tripeptide--D-alanyl-D-alanine ligase n=1 Tax=Truepera radiovictrix (strain DSM 17093 / CIP 108686 / LMG 22925 / RQ-24) TaxID=649638 RepID=D7CY82_TRURR|nr:UDP-N-acetylmuramoyl-tripeptide--D-alanyl-D-alanine ligase [Truepera radiovictrix]ADI14721.1 UDP-N-acetylmuramoylalanyl-D-glutamyl-2,6-diaminopimelate/D-alanyl-D-alanyl ligase [Truepera radiovictrix DSM 17093]WMT56729.1 UDP-N-acetylmuramoyl-tripeptide--D-alanyl-D-alanine ligase [Truepera radiovictrix]